MIPQRKLFRAIAKIFNSLMFICALSSVSEARVEPEYTVDGYVKTSTVYIRSALTNLYLHADTSRNIRQRELSSQPPLGFVWVIPDHTAWQERAVAIYSVKKGLILGQGDSNARLHAYTRYKGQEWTLKENPNIKGEFLLIDKRGRGLYSYKNRAILRKNPSFSDKHYGWRLDKGPAQDLGIVYINAIKAVQTSDGTDGATDAMFKTIEFAMQYGGAIKSAGTAGAKFAAKQLAKKTAQKAANKAARQAVLNAARISVDKAIRLQAQQAAKKAAKAAAKKAAQQSVYQSIRSAAKKAAIDAAGEAAQQAARKGLTAVRNKELVKFAARKVVKSAAKKAGKEYLKSQKRANDSYSIFVTQMQLVLFGESAANTDDAYIKSIFTELAKEAVEADEQSNKSASGADAYALLRLDATKRKQRLIDQKLTLYLLGENSFVDTNFENLSKIVGDLDAIYRKHIEAINRHRRYVAWYGGGANPFDKDLVPFQIEQLKAIKDLFAHSIASRTHAAGLAAGGKPAQKNDLSKTQIALAAVLDEPVKKLVQKLKVDTGKYNANFQLPDMRADIKTCKLEQRPTPLELKIVTLEKIQNITKELKQARKEQSDSDIIKDVFSNAGNIVLELMDPAIIRNILSPLIDDTDDQLMININDHSVWPGGGKGHRDISKGETKYPHVGFVFDRQKGFKIWLEEYDSGSSDDGLGELKVSTDGLDGTEYYGDAIIRDKSEGSIYTVDFSIESLNGKHRVDSACDRVSKIDNDFHEVIRKFEAAMMKLTKKSLPLQAILDKFGEKGLNALRAGTTLEDDLAKNCKNNGNINFGKALAGTWRVGLFNDTLEKNRDYSWTVTFTEDGKIFTPNYYGTWKPEPITSNGKWYSRQWLNQIHSGKGRKITYKKVFTYEKQIQCGVILKLSKSPEWVDWTYDTREFLGDKFLSVNLVNGKAHAYMYGTEWAGNPFVAEVVKFARSVNNNIIGRRNVEYRPGIAIARGDGPSIWLEKIEPTTIKSQESPAQIAMTKKSIVGIWRNHRLTRPDGWTRSFVWELVLTSDNIVIAPESSEMYQSMGIWEHIGDRRISVIMEDAIFPQHSASGPMATKTNILYLDLDGYKPDFHMLYRKKQRYTDATRVYDYVRYDRLNDLARDSLEKYRLDKGMDIPTEEAKRNKLSLVKMREEREVLRKATHNSGLTTLENNRKTEIKKRNLKLIADNLGKCSWGNGGAKNTWQLADENKAFIKTQQNLVGKWDVWRTDSTGSKYQKATWNFNETGKVSGEYNGKKWAAKWSATDGCLANINFDESTAKSLNIPTKLEIRILFQKGGDKELYIIDLKERTSSFWGEQIVDTSLYTYDYAKIKFTTAQLANQCSKRVLNTEIRAKNIAVEVDFYGTQEPRQIYKTNFKSGNAEFMGALPTNKLITHSAHRGEEFVVIDSQSRCVATIDTTRSEPERRTTIQPSSWSWSPLLDVSVHSVEALTANQIKGGCADHRKAKTHLSSEDQRKAKTTLSSNSNHYSRFIFNTSSSDMFVYEVGYVPAANTYSGAYESSKPIAVVKPGESTTVKDRLGRKYTILDEQNKCVGVIELTMEHRYGFDFGDESTPIKDPDYVTPLQRMNGCLDLGAVRSGAQHRNYLGYRTTMKNLGVNRAVSNTGGIDLHAYWMNYDGVMDKSKPDVTIKPGETQNLIDYSQGHYTILDSNDKCVAVKPLGVDVKETKWILGDGSVPIVNSKAPAILPRNIVKQLPYNEIQIANGCNDFATARSVPIDANPEPFVFMTGSDITVHWASYYGALENWEPTREARPIPVPSIEYWERQIVEKTKFAFLFSSKHIRSDIWSTHAREGDVFIATDAEGQCVGVFKPKRHDRINLQNKKDSDQSVKESTQKGKEKAATDKRIADLTKRHAEGQCGPDGILTAESIEGLWKTGGFNKMAERVYRDIENSWVVSSLNEDMVLEINHERAVTEAHCKLATSKNIKDGYNYVNVIFNLDGSKEFFDLTEDGKLNLWGQLSPGLSKLADADAAPDTVAENATPGTPVGVTAFASDADDEVSYGLVKKYFTTGNGLFAIDAKTGVVTLVGKLDYEKSKIYIIQLEATSTDGRMESEIFEILVTNANEFGIGGITDSDDDPLHWSENYRIDDRLYESAPVGTRIGITAFASDADGEDVITYSLADDAGGRFAIDAKTGVIKVSGMLDWETVKSHTILAKATSSDGSSSQKKFTIKLEDANEFQISELTDSNPLGNAVDENSPNGTIVGVTALATDADGSAAVRYSIDDKRNGTAFLIDAKTGVLTLNTSLNHEHDKAININIRATSSDKSYSEKTFTIMINDVDEFDVGEISNYWSGRLNKRIYEDAKVGDEVWVQVNAKDADSTDVVSYSIANSELMPFQIDSKTGKVTVSRPFLNEEKLKYAVEIVATSTDGSTSEKTFIVYIEDINDNKIRSIADNDNAPNAVFENEKPGTPIGVTALAIDPDSSDTVSYSISDYRSPFSIDAKTGVVTVRENLDYEQDVSYKIIVVATSTDNSISTAEFVVKILNMDEFRIQQIKDNDPAADGVNENSPVGTKVGITAFARDGDASDTVTYKLEDDAKGMLAIDTITGVITLIAPLDYEISGPALFAQVSALSSDGFEIWQNFKINIVDENEFDISEISDTDAAANEVHEQAKPGAIVGITAFARDGDGNERYNTIAYEIVDAAGTTIPMWTGLFSIDSRKGIIMVGDIKKLNPKTDNVSVIRVKATAKDGSSKTGLFNYKLVRDQRWYSNPKGPRVEADFLKVTKVDHKKCVDADDNFNAPATYNNEIEFFDCLQRHTPIFNNWYDDPTYPDILTKFPDVPQTFINSCLDANENENLPLVFNSETAYLECLGRYVPPFVNWYDNPQWPNALSERPLVPQDHINGCYKNNENKNIKVAFNNEAEFVRCLNRFVPPFISWYDNPQWPNLLDDYPLVPNDHISGCYNDNENKSMSAVFNNELEFQKCVARFVPPIQIFVSWYTNPQWPNILSEYPLVPTSHVDACYADNENKNMPGAFNDEVAFVACLDRFAPPFISWYDNPQWPNLLNDYPLVPNDHISGCYNDNENKSMPAVFNNEPEFQKCVARFVPPFVNWYDNPQWPKVLDDYQHVPSDFISACYNDNENHNLPAVFNNESEFVTCLTRFVPPQQSPEQTPVERWYNNPQGPYTEADFPYVSEADRYMCIERDDNENRPDTYNNEVVYFQCLSNRNYAPDVPANDNTSHQGGQTPVERWYNNPQGPYTEADFPYVSEADRYMCIERDDNVNRPDTYNNEVVYFQCLSNRNYAPDVPANDNTSHQGGQTEQSPTSGGRPAELPSHMIDNGCYEQRKASEHKNKDAQLSIQNVGWGNLHVYWVNYEGQNTDYDGNPAAYVIIEPQETMELNAIRGFVYSALREDGSCAGVAKALESRNNFSF